MRTTNGLRVTLCPTNPLWDTQGILLGSIHTTEGVACVNWWPDGTFSREHPENNLIGFIKADHKTTSWEEFLEMNK